MRVSVVIPAYNAEKFIRRAVDSALAQQANFPFEVIVVDDGSTDGTAGLLESYGSAIRVLRQENKGVSAARNAGVAVAAGEFIALLDCDDYWKPGKLQAQVDFFEANASSDRIGVVDTFTEIVNHRGQVVEVLQRIKNGMVFKQLLARNIINQPSSAMIPKQVWDEVGGFDPAILCSEDYDFFLRVARKYEVYTVEEVYCVWVHHDANKTLRYEWQHAQSLELKQKMRAMFPDDVSEADYRRMIARTEAYYIPWYFRGGRYGQVLIMALRMLRHDPRRIKHRSLLFAVLALFGPLGRMVHKRVARDSR